MSNGSISGELVVTDAGKNQFRLVGHEGRFTAPAGVLLEVLDGKAVQVDLADGRVRRITPIEIPVAPVVHSKEVIWGELILRDPISGAFSIAGYDAVYIAPAGLDVRPYAGRQVRVTFDEGGRLTEITAIGSSPRTCVYGDATVAPGSSICRQGTTFTCADGVWVNLGTRCS